MSAQILPATAENIAFAAAELRRGELVAMPTETVYGLAGLALNDSALAKIFAAKERPTFDPLICHVPPSDEPDPDWLAYLQEAKLVNAGALQPLAQAQVQQLLAAFWPGPLTLVLPKTAAVPDLATSGLPTVAVRSPAHPVAQALLRAVGEPLAAPSANRFGRISPTQASHVLAELGDRIGWILDGGDCAIGLESTVLFVHPAGGATLLRPGGISPGEIQRRTGIAVARNANQTSPENHPALAPGQLASHYAPRKPLSLLPSILTAMTASERAALFRSLPPGVTLGLLLAGGTVTRARQLWEAELHVINPASSLVAFSLSESNELTEAARNLFAMLRTLDDDRRVDLLWAEPACDDGNLGYAINDRLRRASQR